MSDSTGVPHILMAVVTGHKYSVFHYEAILNEGWSMRLRVVHGEDSVAKRVPGFEPQYKTGPVPDVVVQLGLGEDTQQPDHISQHGLEYLNELRKEFPDAPILVISRHPPELAEWKVKKAGGSAYLKQDSPDEIREFIEHVKTMLAEKFSAIKNAPR